VHQKDDVREGDERDLFHQRSTQRIDRAID
jgi:hypothetical protein